MNHFAPASIMVIGTDLHFCYLMRRYVKESDHALLFSAPDEGAVDLAGREKPALIVLEAGPMDAKGLQILKHLKANETTCDIPIVLCSWHDGDPRISSDTADIFLRMPILYGDFLGVLENLGI